MIVAGHKAPILRVCMENTVLDLSNVHAIAGDEVLLLGEAGDFRISHDLLAEWQSTSPLTVVAGLGRSLPRHYVSGPGGP